MTAFKHSVAKFELEYQCSRLYIMLLDEIQYTHTLEMIATSSRNALVISDDNRWSASRMQWECHCSQGDLSLSSYKRQDDDDDDG